MKSVVARLELVSGRNMRADQTGLVPDAETAATTEPELRKISREKIRSASKLARGT
jgi:hypothetical protein